MNSQDRSARIEEARRQGVRDFVDQALRAGAQTSPVTPNWHVGWDAQNGLTASGSVTPNDPRQNIDLIVVAFTSPDYQPNRGGTYYTGSFASAGGVKLPGGVQMGFIMQSQQFTQQQYGTTVRVHLQGWVDLTLFSFYQDIVIGQSQAH